MAPADAPPPVLEEAEQPRDASAGFVAEVMGALAGGVAEALGAAPVGSLLASGGEGAAGFADAVGAAEAEAEGEATRQKRIVPPSARVVPIEHAAGAVVLFHSP